MPTKKIGDLPPSERCMSREHNPPSYQVFSPGIYEHTCPECGHVQRFTVRRPRYSVRFGNPERESWVGTPEARIEIEID